MADLQTAFNAFASYGTAAQTEMSNQAFSKMCRDCHIIDRTWTSTDCDLLFNKIKSKGARKITFQQFRDAGIPDIAARKRVSADAIIAQITSAGPATNATQAEAVRFHDDRSQYTGVYAAGGPTSVDRDPANLSGIVDRRVAADVRGATSTQHDQRNA